MKVKIFKIRLDQYFLMKDQKELDEFLHSNEILKYESAFVNLEEQYWSVIVYFNEAKTEVKEPKSEKYSADDEPLNLGEIKIMDSLKLWRSEKAKDQKLPVYFIATNKELFSIAKYKPAKKEELQEIKGFGKHKIENYGEEIIEILESV